MAGIFKQIDMTEGPVGSQIISFTIPMLLGNIAQQLYNTADSVIVGQFVGDNALAAVGATGTVNWMIGSIVSAVSTGFLAYIARQFGYDLSRTCDEIRPFYRHDSGKRQFIDLVCQEHYRLKACFRFRGTSDKSRII